MGGRDRIDRSNILDRETGNRSAAEGNRSCPGKVRPGDGYRCAAGYRAGRRCNADNGRQSHIGIETVPGERDAVRCRDVNIHESGCIEPGARIDCRIVNDRDIGCSRTAKGNCSRAGKVRPGNRYIGDAESRPGRSVQRW